MKNILLLLLVVVLGNASNVFGEQELKAAELKIISDKLQEIAATVSAQSGVASAVSNAATLADEASKIAAATPKDNNDWTGDHLQIKGNLYGLKKMCDGKKQKNECEQAYFAPAFVQFEVSKDSADGNLTITPRDNFSPIDCSVAAPLCKTVCAWSTTAACNTQRVVSVRPWEEHGIYGWLVSRGSPLHFHLWSGVPVQVAYPANFQSVQPYEKYVISKQKIESISYVKYGWTYGALLVPFKYQRGNKSVNFSNSAQMYVGFKRDTNGTAEGPFISAGLSAADVPSGVGTSTTKQAFSYGVGWLFEVKKNSGFQLLMMVGQDVFGANSGYQYEGDIWYSVSLGYSLDSTSSKE